MILFKKKYSFCLFLLAFLLILSFCPNIEIQAQTKDYEFTIQQRRRFDRIEAEIWVKRTSDNPAKIGTSTLILEIDTSALNVSTFQDASYTDTVKAVWEKSSVIDSLSSQFHSQNGYSVLQTKTYTDPSQLALLINVNNLNLNNLLIGNFGKGTFVGKLTFDIRPNSTGKTTGIKWSKASAPNNTKVNDLFNNDLTSKSTFADPTAIQVVGVSLLSPIFNNQYIDKDRGLASLIGIYANSGHPITYERSIDPAKYRNINGSNQTDPNVSWILDYTTDNGSNWIEIGRFAENNGTAASVGNDSRYRSGDIFFTNSVNAYVITTQEGTQVNQQNFRKPIRVVWLRNNNFPNRSESAKIRITQLDSNINNSLASRAKTIYTDQSPQSFKLGKNFFLQLNGNQFLKTKNVFSNSTQLTVETWINLNEVKAGKTGIIASSSGQANSDEGAWMLYLDQGAYPAFRAREILNRGDSNMLAIVRSPYALKSANSGNPLTKSHTQNWVHLAATVEDNKVRLFVDGEIVDEVINSTATDIRMRTTQHPIWIGANPNGSFSASEMLNGGLKGTRVWRTALTQDQLKQRIAGIPDPSNTAGTADIRRSLELCYDFENNINDLANANIQNLNNDLNYYRSPVEINNDSVYFRPDLPHIRLTSPLLGSGLTNSSGDKFDVRWVSYGIGDIISGVSNDLRLEYSVDAGKTWFNISSNTGDTSAVEIEIGASAWEPFRNNNTLANLRSATPFSKSAQVRVRTLVSSNLDVSDTSGTITVARYFALRKKANAKIYIEPKNAMNLIGNEAYIEAWIKPSLFPSVADGYFPIISKHDTITGAIHYQLNLLPTGQLEFKVGDSNGKTRRAISDTLKPINPESITPDNSNWTHVGVYLNNNGGKGKSKIIFYIDGTPQKDSIIINQLDTNLIFNSSNTFITYIGYFEAKGIKKGYTGDLREVRFWNGVPNGTNDLGSEPTSLTQYIQGVANSRAEQLKNGFKGNLHSAFSFNGSPLVYNGYYNAIPQSINTNNFALFRGDSISYVAQKPYIRLVEPTLQQRVSQSKTDLKLRWVGFDYDGLTFGIGTNAVAPAIEYSIKGGGGMEAQPYQFVGSQFYTGNTVNSFKLIDSISYRFKGANADIIYAAQLNVSQANPDLNRNNIFNDQGAMPAALTNARLRVTGSYTIDGETNKIQGESELFTIVPRTNLTLRTLLEGRHKGTATSVNNIKQIARKYSDGGFRVTLYLDNNGTIGNKIITIDSTEGYEDLDLLNRNTGSKLFGNISFLLENIDDGRYWVRLEQLNHLPILSRFAVPFRYIGDDKNTWQIESGWDFQSWDGKTNNTLANQTDSPYGTNVYTARGIANSTPSSADYLKSGLVFNNGVAGSKIGGLPAMVGGDANGDGKIDVADRTLIRQEDGTNSAKSDITGDGFVNADDRTIAERNQGRVSSLSDLTLAIVNHEVKYSQKEKDNKSNTIQVDNNKISYNVWTKSYRSGDFVSLDFYIKNNNATARFKLANSTFAVKFDTSALAFDNVLGGDSVIFTNDSKAGYYSRLRSAPDITKQNRYKDIRSIEIDYDINIINGGKLVPGIATFLGTLRFKLIKKNVPVQFAWHSSTSLHSTDSSIINQYGTFEQITTVFPYAVKLTSPNGRETYISGRNANANWDYTGNNAPVRVELSTNNGSNWQLQNTANVTADMRLFKWTVPVATSKQCLMRLVDAATSIEIDRSDTLFTINEGSASFTSTFINTDGFARGGDQEIVAFDVKGFAEVNLDFSEDGSKWISLVKKLNPATGSFEYTVPFVTTKLARIRMVESSTNIVITTSDLYKVLSATFLFLSPDEFEDVKVGLSYKLRYSTSYLKNFTLQISTNNGTNWQTELGNVPIGNGIFNWRPNIVANGVLLRAIWDATDPVELGRTPQFNIVPATSILEVAEQKVIKYYNNDLFEINEEYINNFFEIYNSVGQQQSFKQQSNKIYINHLPSGIYFLTTNNLSIKFVRE